MRRSGLGKKAGMFVSITLACYLAAAGVAFASSISSIADTGDVVTIQLDQQWTGNDGYWYTGYGFNITERNGSSISPIYEANSFCVDPSEATLGAMTGYHIESLKSAFGIQYVEAAYLLKTYGNTQNAQIAAWEIIFNANGYSYTPHNLSLADASSAAALAAEAKSRNLTNFNLAGFYIFTNPTDNPATSFNAGTQDYLVYDPVPEPSTLLLIGGGLVGLAAFRGKFRKA